MKTNSKSPAKNKINNVDKPNLKDINFKRWKNKQKLENKIWKNNEELEKTLAAIGKQFSKISDYSKINFDQKKEELNSLIIDQNKNQKKIDELKHHLQINEKLYKDGSFFQTETCRLINNEIEKHERCKDQLKSQLKSIDKNDTAQKNKIGKKLKHHREEIERYQQMLETEKVNIKTEKAGVIKRIKEELSKIDHQKQIDKIQNKLKEISEQPEDLRFMDALMYVSDKVFTSKQPDSTVIETLNKIKTELSTLKKDLLDQNTTNLLNYDNDAKNNEIKKNNLQDSFTDDEISFTNNEIRLDNEIKNLEIEVNFETNKKRIDFLDKLINIADLIESGIKIKSELQKLQEKKANLKKSELKPKYSKIYSVSELMQGSGKKNIKNSNKNNLDSDKKTKGRK